MPDIETAYRWTDERTDAALRRFAAGHEVLPTRREFARAGETALLDALHRHGGTELWAARLGCRDRRAKALPP